MSAVNSGLDKRAAAREGQPLPSMLRPPVKLVPLGQSHPRILYVTGDYRVVLRALDRYPEGYVEIERRYANAMNVESWAHADSFSLDPKQHENPKAPELPTALLAFFLRTLVPELNK